MIPFCRVRQAKRRELEAKISARPCPAVFRALPPLNVLFYTPAKAREMKLGGFSAAYTGEAMVALPLGTPPPQSEKDIISITDFSGETIAYTVATSTPLEGLDCYTLGLRARNTRPTR